MSGALEETNSPYSLSKIVGIELGKSLHGDNLKIINSNTQKEDIQKFLQSFQLQTVKLNIDNFENNFSSKSIIENLNSSLHNK